MSGGMSEVLANNLARAALVWMDDWQYFIMFYTSGLSLSTRDNVNVSERMELRERLKCKPFSWYLENVWPDHFFPAPDRFFGKIIWLDGVSECSQTYSEYMKNIPGSVLSRDWSRIFEELDKNSEQFMSLIDLDRDKCLRAAKSDAPRTSLQPATVGDCTLHAQSMDMFVITPSGQIMTNDNVCLTLSTPKSNIIKTLKSRNFSTSNVQLSQCFNSHRQLWIYDMDTQQITHNKTKYCLTIKSAPSTHSKNEKIVVAEECKYHDITQKWGLIPLPWRL